MMEQMKLEDLTSEQINFQLILYSGNARSKVIQSLREYRGGNVEESELLIAQAEQDLAVAHDVHFQLVQKEAQGEKVEISMLFIHSEDHLMSTLTMKELVKELLDIFKAKNI